MTTIALTIKRFALASVALVALGMAFTVLAALYLGAPSLDHVLSFEMWSSREARALYVFAVVGAAVYAVNEIALDRLIKRM